MRLYPALFFKEMADAAKGRPWNFAEGDVPHDEPFAPFFWWLVRLRWLALLGIAFVLFLTGPGLKLLPEGSAIRLWGVAALLFTYNATLTLLGPRRVSWVGHNLGQIFADCLALAGLVHFAGGIENPFMPLFVLHVVNANIVLNRRSAMLVMVLMIVLLLSVVLGEGSGIVTHYCLRPEAGRCFGTALGVSSLGVLTGLVLTLFAASSITRFLTGRLLGSQKRLARTVDELKSEKSRLAATREDIERERSKLQAIIDCMGDAVVFSDSQGRVLLSNNRAQKLWRSHGSDKDALQENLDSRVWNITELFADFEGKGNSGTYSLPVFERGGRAFEATYSVVRAQKGEALGSVIVARDITERLAMERRLMREESMSVVGKLAAAVAHEINNPIGVVSLYTQHALTKLDPDSPVRSHLETILRNADGCRKIIGDLLALARPRTPVRGSVNLRSLCRDVVKSVMLLAEGAGVHIRLEDDRQKDSSLMKGDADQLRQAVLNLALNAIEACGRGDVVSVRVFAADRKGAPVNIIEIHDTGVGLAAEDRERIFDPFFTTKDMGTGLGLAVARNIVKGHAGWIEVESDPGSGTTFRVVLPGPMVSHEASDQSVPSPEALVREAGSREPEGVG